MALVSDFGSEAPTPRLGRAAADLWHGLVKDLFASYRPEQHYMRGPGPAWRAKHPGEAAPNH